MVQDKPPLLYGMPHERIVSEFVGSSIGNPEKLPIFELMFLDDKIKLCILSVYIMVSKHLFKSVRLVSVSVSPFLDNYEK